MAIFLKELTIRYSPKNGGLTQAAWDYYAMFSLWKTQGSGGKDISPAPERKRQVVDDVFEQVAKHLGKRIISALTNYPFYKKKSDTLKELKKFKHYLKMEDWMNYHASVNYFLELLMDRESFDDALSIEVDPTAKGFQLSPVIKKVFGYKSPSQPEPSPQPVGSTSPPVPRPAPKPKDVPPNPDLTGIDPPSPVMGIKGKQLGNPWENFIRKLGYGWDEIKQAYVDGDNVIQINKDNSAIGNIDGNLITFENLGELFQTLLRNKKEKEKNPATALKEENFKLLYKFLYS